MNPELAEAAALVWATTTGRTLAKKGCPPTLVWLTAQIRATLPPGHTVQALEGFVLRNQWALMEMVDTAFRQASPPGGPLDVCPPQVGVLHRSMSLPEAEAAMRGEAEEHLVIFNATTGAQIARFGPEMTRAQGKDPRGLTVIDTRLYRFGVRAGSWILSHNHPRCGPLSTADLILAVSMNLKEMRAVCADGQTWRIERPPRRWPEYFDVRDISEEAYDEAYIAASERYGDPNPILSQAPGMGIPLDVEPSADWTRHFDQTFRNYFNVQGRGLGLRIDSSAPDGPHR